MSLAIALLKAPHVGIRDLKENLSKFLKKNSPLVVTERGEPVDVILPYSEMMDLVDIFEEVTDPETLATVMEGKKAVRAGSKGVPISNLFKAIREKRK